MFTSIPVIRVSGEVTKVGARLIQFRIKHNQSINTGVNIYHIFLVDLVHWVLQELLGKLRQSVGNAVNINEKASSDLSLFLFG